VSYEIQRRGTAHHQPPDTRRRYLFTAAEIIERLRQWNREYGEPPRMIDLEPARARREGQAWRAERFESGNWPSAPMVAAQFGSLNAALSAACGRGVLADRRGRETVEFGRIRTRPTAMPETKGARIGRSRAPSGCCGKPPARSLLPMVGEPATVCAPFQIAGPRQPDLRGARRADRSRGPRDHRRPAGTNLERGDRMLGIERPPERTATALTSSTGSRYPSTTRSARASAEDGGQFATLSGELSGFDIGGQRGGERR